MRYWIFVGLILMGLLILNYSEGPSVQAADTGNITGKVVLKGEVPQPKKLEVTKDHQVCGNEKEAQNLVVAADGGVKWAVATVQGLTGTPANSEKPPTFDQKGCNFNPHVLIVPAGKPIDIMNNDGILHNIHTHSTVNRAFNQSQPKFRKRMRHKFDKAEIIKVSCDVHPWMLGYLVVVDHPYVATTEDAGTFKIAGVPAGTQTLEIWHETLGKVTKQVEVKAGADTNITIELTR